MYVFIDMYISLLVKRPHTHIQLSLHHRLQNTYFIVHKAFIASQNIVDR